MDDLISRQDVIDITWEEPSYTDPLNILSEIRDKIKSLPLAHPKKGKWIDTGGNEEWYAREYRCSECGGTMLGEANFCPNCGAKMEVTT